MSSSPTSQDSASIKTYPKPASPPLTRPVQTRIDGNQVQTIVNVIEPDHGVVFDPACGSGGMFVQTSHFIEGHGLDTGHRVTFYGQEKTATTIRLAKMNLAVHGLEGDIREANTFYEDVHRLPENHSLWGNCDFVMANPPFNVDMVDADKVKTDRRLPFGLPGAWRFHLPKKSSDLENNIGK